VNPDNSHTGEYLEPFPVFVNYISGAAMIFELTEEQNLSRDMVREFAEA